LPIAPREERSPHDLPSRDPVRLPQLPLSASPVLAAEKAPTKKDVNELEKKWNARTR
jgi:hypothetical protein